MHLKEDFRSSQLYILKHVIKRKNVCDEGSGRPEAGFTSDQFMQQFDTFL